MKKTLLTAAVTVACVGALAQGTVNFSSTPSAIGSTQLVTDPAGTPLAGADYFAQLYMGPDAASLAPQGRAANFLTGGGAGYFRDTEVVVVDNVAPGASGVAVVKAWEASGGASYEAALASGALTGANAAPFVQATGGAGSPPGLPANLVNFTAFSLVPEPSTAALGILGAIALMLRRRK